MGYLTCVGRLGKPEAEIRSAGRLGLVRDDNCRRVLHRRRSCCDWYWVVVALVADTAGSASSLDRSRSGHSSLYYFVAGAPLQCLRLHHQSGI